jgi:diguanylate cyclase (GGDEF)-like protein
MARSFNFLSSKITRRIFSVFLLFSLVPVCVFSYLAIDRLSEATDQQVSDLLENETRNLSYLILERLGFAEKLLSTEGLNPGKSAETLASLGTRAHLPDSQLVRLIDTQDLQQGLDQSSWQHLQQGGTVIAGADSDRSITRTFMLKAIGTANGATRVKGLLLESDFVLGTYESRNLNIEICVIDAANVVLYATRASLCGGFLSAAQTPLGHKGELSFGENTRYFSRYRSLFLQQRFASANWTVVVMQPADELLLASMDFRKNFISVALGVILSLCLASIYFIRTRMAPLAVIMAGIERVSAKHYDQRVEVDSGDEFQELAEAFNTMSGQVSRQLDNMASMAEIDKLMLTRRNKSEVIELVLTSATAILPSDGAALFVFDSEHETQCGAGVQELGGNLFTLDADSTPGFKSQALSITLSDELLKSPAIFLDREQPHKLNNLFTQFPEAVGRLEMLPLQRDGAITGLFIYGYNCRQMPDEDAEKLARNFADRISVALANAQWEDKLYQQAHFDALTGLPNRLSLLDRMNHSIKLSERSGRSFAVSFIDLDDFKLINDSLGHMAGDQMIEIVASRLQHCIRAGDTVARMGGDEFVLISAPFDCQETAATAMTRIAEKLLATIAQPLDICGREVRSSSSIGIAIFPRDGHDSDSLLKNADTAMYEAKAKGRAQFQFFSEKLNEESVALMNLSTDMKRALEAGEFELYYQPKIAIPQGELVGAEALIRWNHPTRGMVSPGEFIQVAERMGLISALGDWTLHEACRQIKSWQGMGLTPPRIAVNMSAIQIHREDMPAKMCSLLKQYQVSPDNLELEIVEGVLIEDMAATEKKLRAIREMGIHISIDDYGTGYSSLSYVRSFPVDTLKVDRCFITNICTDPADKAIVHSTIVLAHSLQLEVIAEGVENSQQLLVLQELGCDQVQGFHFSRPVPAEKFSRFLCPRVPAVEPDSEPLLRESSG